MDKSDPIIELVYFSRSIKPLTNEDVQAILTGAREKNATLEVGGILIFCNDFFVQVLEGGRSNVNQIYSSICCDARHFDINLVSVREVKDRCYKNWHMAYLGGKNQKKLSGEYIDFDPSTLTSTEILRLLKTTRNCL